MVSKCTVYSECPVIHGGVNTHVCSVRLLMCTGGPSIPCSAGGRDSGPRHPAEPGGGARSQAAGTHLPATGFPFLGGGGMGLEGPRAEPVQPGPAASRSGGWRQPERVGREGRGRFPGPGRQSVSEWGREASAPVQPVPPRPWRRPEERTRGGSRLRVPASIRCL